MRPAGRGDGPTVAGVAVAARQVRSAASARPRRGCWSAATASRCREVEQATGLPGAWTMGDAAAAGRGDRPRPRVRCAPRAARWRERPPGCSPSWRPRRPPGRLPRREPRERACRARCRRCRPGAAQPGAGRPDARAGGGRTARGGAAGRRRHRAGGPRRPARRRARRRAARAAGPAAGGDRRAGQRPRRTSTSTGATAWSARRCGSPTTSAVRRLAQRLAAAGGRRLDDATPYVDVRLPDGTRLHAVLAPIARPRHLRVAARAAAARSFSLDDLVAAGSVDRDAAPAPAATWSPPGWRSWSAAAPARARPRCCRRCSVWSTRRAAGARRGLRRAGPRPPPRGRPRGPAAQRRGRRRGDRARPGPAGAADASGPARRGRGPRAPR